MGDRQNRIGSKIGGGGVMSESQAEMHRRARIRKLAQETIDLSKDPYFMKNHLGSFECKLCLTLHPNEGNYLAHAQGSKHQAAMAKKSQKEGTLSGVSINPAKKVAVKRNVKTIGRPGYRVTKVRDAHTSQIGLLFQIHYPRVSSKPRHRIMSAFEQKVEVPPDRNFVAAEPYEIIGFKIPNMTIDRNSGRFWS